MRRVIVAVLWVDGKVGDVQRHGFGCGRKRCLAVRLAPGLEVRPIRSVRPDGVLGFRLVDELGSPVCDFCQRADLGVPVAVEEGSDRLASVKRRLNLDTLPLSHP